MLDMTATRRFYRLSYSSEGHDCSVRSVAVACKVPYSTAHAAMHFAGRGPHGAASMEMIATAIRSLGFYMYPVVVKSKTMRKLTVELRGEPGCFIAECPTHVVGFYQGECIDWSRDTLTRITNVYVVTQESHQ